MIKLLDVERGEVAVNPALVSDVYPEVRYDGRPHTWVRVAAMPAAPLKHTNTYRVQGTVEQVLVLLRGGRA